MKRYRAPWGPSLLVITLVSAALCAGVPFWLAHAGHRAALAPSFLLCGGILAGAALFTIRGYALAPDALLVQRLLWVTRLPLANLRSVSLEPEAMRRSLRTFGNGGLFSFTGRYRNRTLGCYRAFVTDPRRTVVLRYPDRTVVISPEPPGAFVEQLRAQVAGGGPLPAGPA